VLNELAGRYQMLLFDNNEIALSDIYHSLYFKKTGTQKLKMPCAVNAS
jgi:hypothetical protein